MSHYHAMWQVTEPGGVPIYDERSISPTRDHADSVVQMEQDSWPADFPEFPEGTTVEWSVVGCACQRGEDHIREVNEDPVNG